MIEDGDLVAFDTDLIGIGGYPVDMSRTWIASDRPPTGAQQRLWEEARIQLRENTRLLQPGASFAEISQGCHLPPDDIHSRTNLAVAHGVGLCNEYPLIVNRDHADTAYDGEIEVGMVLCVEALAASPAPPDESPPDEQPDRARVARPTSNNILLSMDSRRDRSSIWDFPGEPDGCEACVNTALRNPPAPGRSVPRDRVRPSSKPS